MHPQSSLEHCQRMVKMLEDCTIRSPISVLYVGIPGYPVLSRGIFGSGFLFDKSASLHVFVRQQLATVDFELEFDFERGSG